MSENKIHSNTHKASPLLITENSSNYRGRKFVPIERQPSCLEQLWQYITYIFSYLCCCCNNGEVEIEIGHAIQSQQTIPYTLTPPKRSTPPPPPKVEPEVEPKVEPEVQPEVEPKVELPEPEPVIFEYPPLEEVKAKRSESVCYTPNFKEPPLPLRNGPFLEAFEKALGAPEVKDISSIGMPIPLKHIRNGAVAKLQTICAGMLQGEVKITSSDSAEALLKIEFSSPWHLIALQGALDKYLEGFNALFETKGGQKIAREEVFGKFIEIEPIIEVWKELETIAESRFLKKEHLPLLQRACTALPEAKHEIYTSFPLLLQALRKTASFIGTKWNLEALEMDEIQVLKELFAEKLILPFFYFNSALYLDRHAQEFIQQLADDLFSLFPPQKEEKILQLLEEYVISEIGNYNQAMVEFYARFPELGTFTSYDPQKFITSIHDFFNLENICAKSLIFKTLDRIDEKILLLGEIADELPPSDSLAWKWAPLHKNALIDFYESLDGKFSKYIFEQVADDREKYLDDKNRKAIIDYSLEMIAEKLGCPKPGPSVIDMYVKDDDKISGAEREAYFETEAQEIGRRYRAMKELGHQAARDQVIEYLKSLKLGNAQERKETLQKIIAALHTDLLQEELSVWFFTFT